MIKLVGLHLNQLPNRHALIALLDGRLYGAWRDRHKSIRDELAARASLAGLLLLQQMGIRENLSYDEKGRPFIKDTLLDFNITHTGHMVFGTFESPDRGEALPEASPCRVGVDAENLARIASVRIAPLAARCFTEAEHELFLQNPTDDTFLQIWTRKESLVKWLGDGLRLMHRADTVTARETYGVEFSEYKVGDTVITLCHRLGTKAPEALHLLTSAELFD